MNIRPITDTLREIRNGALLEECDQALHQLIDDCLLAHKTGTLTISIKLTPPKQGSDYMHVLGDVKASKPVTPAETMFFMDNSGNLVRRNPKQPELGFAAGEVDEDGVVTEVDSQQQPAKEA